MTRTMALIFGLVFLAIGILGFFPGFLEPPVGGRDLAFEHGHGQLLGLFPVNTLHNIVHIVFGIWGLAAYRSLGGARGYFRAVAIIYAIFAIMGLIPMLDTTFGLVPLYGNDVWLHILLAVIAAYFGWMHRDAPREHV